MPTLPVRRFEERNNARILNNIRNQASPEYTRRIPSATDANMSQMFDTIWQHSSTRNEFIDALVNVIGRIVGRSLSWSNPLAKFKIGMLNHGDTIEEYAVGLVDEYVYDPDRDYMERDLFGQSRPEVKSAFHKVTRRGTFKITINESALRKAFYDDGGIAEFVNEMMAAPITSDNYNEYLLMVSLFKQYYDAGGFFKVNVPNVNVLTASKEDSAAFLKVVREYSELLTFPATHYNAAHMPVAADIGKLEIFLTPRAKANIDVDMLAQVFNIDRADVPARMTVVREEDFAIPGAQAVITTRDFFMVADTYMETASQPNAAGRYTNYFFHHDQIISASPFVPAVLLTTEPGDEITISDPVITGVTDLLAYFRGRPDDVTTDALRGDYVQITGTAITNPEGGLNDGVVLTISGAQSDFTYVNNEGTLFTGLDESASALIVTATSSRDPEFSKSITLTVKGPRIIRNKLEETVEEPETEE